MRNQDMSTAPVLSAKIATEAADPAPSNEQGHRLSTTNPSAANTSVVSALDHDAATAARLWLASRGFHIFPLIPDTKRPGVRDWENRATTDPALVRNWPTGAGTGIATGPSGLVVLDLDAHGGTPPENWDRPGITDGHDVFASVWAEHETERSMWDTFVVATPSGGSHLYFRAPQGTKVRNSAGRIGWQVDVRAEGGYVVAPGTTLPNGAYKPVTVNLAPAPLPGWLTGLIVDHKPVQGHAGTRRVGLPSRAGNRVDALARTVAVAQPGERNHVLNWAAYQLATDRILTRENAGVLLTAARTAGLDDAEAVATIRSAAKGVPA